MAKTPVTESTILDRLNKTHSIQRHGMQVVKTPTGAPYAQIIENGKVVREFGTPLDLIDYAREMKCIEAWEEVLATAVARARKAPRVKG